MARRVAASGDSAEEESRGQTGAGGAGAKGIAGIISPSDIRRAFPARKAPRLENFHNTFLAAGCSLLSAMVPSFLSLGRSPLRKYHGLLKPVGLLKLNVRALVFS